MNTFTNITTNRRPDRRRRPLATGLTTVLVGFLSLCMAPSVFALKSDADQPATIKADDVELDFKTGERIYSGNVFVRQGSMELTCDKLVATFKDEKLAVATAFGSAEKLAVFKQRPDDQPNDVIGKAVTMILDQVEQLVTLTDNASLNQGTDTVTGQKILYDMKLEKMRVKGSETTIQQQPSGSAEPEKQESDTTAATGTNSALPKAPEPEPVVATPTVSNDSETAESSTTESDQADTPAANTDVNSVANTAADETISDNPQMVVPNDSVLSRGTSGRPRMIIQPRSKRNP